MDPELFYQLNDLGATPGMIAAVQSGEVEAEALLAHLQSPEATAMDSALQAPRPLPAPPPQPLPVLASTTLPTIEPLQQPVVRAVAPPREEPIEYVRVDEQPANQGPIAKVAVDDPALGSWLIEDEDEVYPQPENQAVNGYPQFAGSEQILPFVASAIVSTATEKLFDKGAGNSVAKVTSPRAIRYSKRRRRRRLLTCSDKADIAYLVGQLGQGQLGKAAISALLSKRCG